MSKKAAAAVILVFVAILLHIFIPAHQGSLAGFSSDLEKILPQESDRQNFDLSDTVINLSALIDTKTDKAKVKTELSRMQAELKSRIADSSTPDSVIAAFNSYFFDTLGFTFDQKFEQLRVNGTQAKYDDFLNFHSIERVIERRQGICLTISMIYLMLGDKLGLPLYGVMVPGHIYVRYKEPGRSGVNVETTVSGAEFYGYKDMIVTLDNTKTIYGKELDKYSLVGAYLANLGNFMLITGRTGRAKILLEKSATMLPEVAEAYFNLGILYETEKNLQKAAENYEKALSILPGNEYAHLRLGAIYLEEKRYTLAKSHFEAVLTANPKNAEADNLLNKAKKEAGL